MCLLSLICIIDVLKWGATALFFAVLQNDTQLVEQLLASGAEILFEDAVRFFVVVLEIRSFSVLLNTRDNS